MLSEAVKLYLQTWETEEIHVRWEKGERERYFAGRAFVHRYRDLFEELCGINWSECPADFDLLEQITLARNATQHPEHISTLEARHDMKSRARFPSPFFVRETERHMVSVDNPLAEWFAPNIHVSRDKLLTAIAQVELLADWLEDRLLDAKYNRA